MLELTVVSAQGLKISSSFSPFTYHLKPFVTITTFPSPPMSLSSSSSNYSIKGYNNSHVYTTRVDNEGGPNPTWDDKFLQPLHPTFFTSNYSCVYLQLYTKRALLGPAVMGWIQIPTSDILDGHSPLGLAHHLSYRLREKDGSRGHGVVNVACKFVGDVPAVRQASKGGENHLAAVDTWRTVIGVPTNTVWPMRMKCSDKVDNVTRTNEW